MIRLPRPNLPAPLPLLILASSGAFVFGIGVVIFLEQVVVWGRYVRVAPHELPADYVTGVIWAVLLGLTIPFWPVPRQHRQILLWLWLVRSLITLVVMLPYEYTYDILDAHHYFSKSRIPITNWDISWPGNTDNVYIIVQFHHTFISESYHAMKVSFSMLGFIAVYLFYRAAMVVIQAEHPLLLIILGIYPSILFWSSIIGKDPIVIMGIALYALGVVLWYRDDSLSSLLLVLAGVVIVMAIRPWMGIILCVPLVAFVGHACRSFKTFVVFGAFLLLLYSFSDYAFQGTVTVTSSEEFVQKVNRFARVMDVGGSAQNVDLEFATMNDVLAFAPWGAFSALFRPLPGEVNNPFGIIVGIENAMMLMLVLLSLIHLRWRMVRNPIVLWLALVVLLWAVAYGLFASYNFGTLARFRLQVLPFLLCLLLYLGWEPTTRQIMKERATNDQIT